MTKTVKPEKSNYQNWPRDNAVKPKGEENKLWLKGRSKILTGWCSNYPEGGLNMHEGTKPKNWRGKPMKTCPAWDTCPCECHQRIDQMFKLANMERIEVPNPEYIPAHSEFVIPEYESPVPVDVALSPDGVMTPPSTQQPVESAPVVTTTPLAQRRTDTGRSARGGLEAQVWDACITFVSAEKNLDNYEGGPITPKLIAEWIAAKYKIPTPSSGAINAVWDRWEKFDFAKQGKKPNRFIDFTGDSSWDHLQRIKVSRKIQEKSAASAVRRGLRR